MSTRATSGRELREIHTLPQLVKYLHNDLGWPIEADSFHDLEDFTFDWGPEELGIDAANAAKIEYIKQLRPLERGQPTGVFFIKFDTRRLPVVALRRVLSKLVVKKRANAAAAERPLWAMRDLVFISSYGDSEERQLSFAYFQDSEDGLDLPTLKVLGWDNLDTPLHLDRVDDELRQYLSWPENSANLAEWRSGWSKAFQLRNREVVTTSRDLSIRLAALARAIRDRIRAALAVESETGPLTTLMKAFQSALIHDLDEDGFADMYAQTIAYGLLSARIADPHKKTVDDFAAHMRTNPFLCELMETFLKVGGRRGKAGGPGIDFDELGVSEVVELLDDANMEAVVLDFGDRNPQEDPVTHFYEGFASEYDPIDKVRRGEFYTPRPVVSFMVRSVDELLRTEFGLVDGLADTATWGDMAHRHRNLTIPDGVSASQDFIQILDPATGTGTFLVEIIDHIHKTLVAKWTTQGHDKDGIVALWNEYVPKHLLSRLHAYELKMAPYAIAHLKIGLKLHETAYNFGNDQRARIYLTNSLEPASDRQLRMDYLPALAHEARAVNEVKRERRFTVVIGNPPYANYSANLSAQARRIVDKYRSFRGAPIRERNQLQFERNIQDDFVKFISIGQDVIAASGVGVLSYITNGTMIASTSLRGMREGLGRTFSSLFELNLHGGGNEIIAGVEDDENVFDIVQSVAIHLYVRSQSGGATTVSYSDLLGRRAAKYAALASRSVMSMEWQRFQPDIGNASFSPQDEDRGDNRRLDSVFVKFGAGIKTNRDAVAIGFDDASLLAAVRKFDSKLIAPRRNQDNIKSLLYRPFDVRRVFYHEDVVASRSLPTMKHFIEGPNIGLLCSSTWTTPTRFSVGVSRLMVEMKSGTHDRGTTFFPLYRYERLLEGEVEKIHNFAPEFVREWCAITATQFVPTGHGDCVRTTGPEDVLSWLFALFYSPEYRRRYRAALAQRFPIVLLTSNREFLRQLIQVGTELISVHLLESLKCNQRITTFVGRQHPEVEKISWSNDTVWIDRALTTGFRGVSEAVWDFHVGGYPVCEKWLKDRKGRKLTNDEIDFYQRIVVGLNETILVMREVDEVIETHGGWPAVFETAGLARRS